MYRLLIVDDEEIITDGLYEVFSRFMPDRLDVCKAYSGQEALDWMARTRIDIVLADIAMPGLNGLDLAREIQHCWPRCHIVFLTGHSEFDYAYQAFQLRNVRYLLKTEGYGKLQDVVREIVQDMQRARIESRLLEQSREKALAYEMMARGDYLRYLLQDSERHYANREVQSREFRKLNIDLDPGNPVVLVLGRLSYPAGKTYTERSEILASARSIWDAYLSEHTRIVDVTDRHGDVIWFIQPRRERETADGRLIRFLEGTLELIQEACLASLDLRIGFTISGDFCDWEAVTRQYERLRELQQLMIGDGTFMILRDRGGPGVGCPGREAFMFGRRTEQLAAHLEAGRAEAFFADLDEFANAALHAEANVQQAIQAYYSVAVLLYAHINRFGLHDQVGDYRKLLRLDDHASMKEGFRYLKQIAQAIFRLRQRDARNRASQVVDRICRYIEEHLHEDISLVRLAEAHYFNPSYLSRLFKQELGINLSEYIDQCRIRRAKELLGNGDLKIRDVAASVGYEAAHSFTRFFKKVTGMTPQEYRDALSAG
ncbi:MAG: DNA-binding response regulator [Thermobacillus sp. ZCTH02-B1]|uniref:helix-turn-helix domain-containing protein n=1 Tax=Thermobacillus sp. ZCTH02-B1 TaxID=1858795 RepID=UPI000B558187|nr:helix-turn-helix domain-containing protein [Thermobacillus sp. ZCTH02-B1]OUM97543.1 MAG: DNA-binding response regulator [Thermobacillus sp. ZCTH02-B1]